MFDAYQKGNPSSANISNVIIVLHFIYLQPWHPTALHIAAVMFSLRHPKYSKSNMSCED